MVCSDHPARLANQVRTLWSQLQVLVPVAGMLFPFSLSDCLTTDMPLRSLATFFSSYLVDLSEGELLRARIV